MTCRGFVFLALALAAMAAQGDLLPADVDLADGPGNVGTPATFLTAPPTYEAGSSNQCLAYGDFNRDGFDDLVLAFPNSDVGGANSGIVYVVFGAASFPAERVASTNPVASVYCQDAGATLGAAVAAGDLDGDGRDELILGAPGYDSGRGAVAVINGTTLLANGSQGIGFAAADPSGTEMRILGTEEGAQFGYSLATGDFDQDEKSDAAVGAPYADSGVKVDTGKCFVWYGDGYVPGSKVNDTALPDRWMIVGGEGNNVGSALAAGDATDDGLDDLFIGAVGYGSASRVYGMGVLSPGTTDYALDDPGNVNHGWLEGVPGLGYSLALGDATGEGRDELLMGAPIYGRSGMANSGVVIEYQLAQIIPTGVVETLDVDTPVQSSLVILGANDGGLFGASVAYTDLNGDGLPDMAIGEPGGPGADAQAQAGRVHVRYTPEGLLPAGVVDLALGPLSSTITGQAALGYCGGALTGDGDANGDGIADLFVLAPFAVQGAEGLGNSYLLFGGRDPEASMLATARVPVSPGDTPAYAIGGRLSPVVRAKVQFAGGSQATVLASIYPGDAPQGLTGDNDGGTEDRNTARVYWYLSTQRTNVTSMDVTLNYTDAEIAGFDENYLAVYLSENGSAPWSRAAVQTHDPASNEFTVTLTGTVADMYFGIAYEAPIIDVLGNNPESLNCGMGAYVDAGVLATSAVDGDISHLVVVDDGGLDVNTPGEYTLRYNVTDSTGAAAVEQTRTVIVADWTDPSIVLTGDQNVNVPCGGTYAEPGFTATDDCDGILTAEVQVSGDTVDPATLGTYHVTYTVEDAAGNVFETTRNVLVVDWTLPVIERLGGIVLQWECGVPWVDPGATATDACDGDISGEIEIVGVAPAVPVSDFVLTYQVTDSAGNFSGEYPRTVNVEDHQPPVIELTGGPAITIPCGEPYTDAGAAMTDLCEGDITFKMQVQNGVDVNVAGVYEVTYFGTDASSNAAVQVTRTVTVECPADSHSADQDGNNQINLSELLRVIQFYNSANFGCETGTEDGFAPNDPDQGCTPHASDYNPQDWDITLSELLRLIQFYNSGGYHPCLEGEDGFCPGA